MNIRTNTPSKLTYIAAIMTSGLAFLLTLVLILEFKYPNLERAGGADIHPIAVAMLFSALLGAVFAAIRPFYWLRLAVLSSSIFWGFFSVVFICYLLNSEVEWVPLGQALLTLGSAIGGALLSTRALPQLWRRERTQA